MSDEEKELLVNVFDEDVDVEDLDEHLVTKLVARGLVDRGVEGIESGLCVTNKGYRLMVDLFAEGF